MSNLDSGDVLGKKYSLRGDIKNFSFFIFGQKGGGNAGQLTSLEASLMRCFTFSKASPKTSGVMFFQNIAKPSHH